MSKTQRELEPDFLQEPESYAESVCSNNLETHIVDVDKDLNQIFGFRDSCTERIPSTPEYLDNSSSSLSRVSRTRPVDDEGSRSVRRRSEFVDVEGNEHESMLRAVAVLDEMHSAELIDVDVDTLYRIIGVIIAEPSFVKALVSTTSTSAQRVEFVHLFLQDSSESAIRETISVKSSTIHSSKASDLIISMHDQNMITGADVVSLAKRIEVDRVLVSYLLCNVAKERKAEMLPKFLEVIKSRES